METFIKRNTDGTITKAASGFDERVLRAEGYFPISERLVGIQDELRKVDLVYSNVLSTAVEYIDGYTYLPSYVNGYVLLIAGGVSPVTIWDSTGLNSTSKTTAELTTLASFLKDTAESAFQARKESRKLLLEEKVTLEELI